MNPEPPYRPDTALDPAARSARAHLRAGAVFYTLLIAHLSLYPYSGWRELGVGAWEYWITPWIPPQQRFLVVDAAFNVLAYIPLGSLLLVSLPLPWRRFAWASLLAWLCATLLSAGLEALQTFLPSRVPSKMDLLCNSAGAALGVLLARSVLALMQQVRAAITPPMPGLLDETHWQGTVTMGLWLFCLLSPLPLAYVTGPWLGDIWLFFVELDAGEELAATMEWLADWESPAQIIASLAGLGGALCLGLAQTPAGGRRLPLFMLLVVLAALAGWLGPQTIPLLQGQPLHSPLQWWGETGLLSVLAAALAALCLALSDWSSRRLALISLGLLTVSVAATGFLPGYSQLALRPEAVPSQRTLGYLTAAADWIGAIWPALGLLTAWRLSRTRG